MLGVNCDIVLRHRTATSFSAEAMQLSNTSTPRKLLLMQLPGARCATSFLVTKNELLVLGVESIGISRSSSTSRDPAQPSSRGAVSFCGCASLLASLDQAVHLRVIEGKSTRKVTDRHPDTSYTYSSTMNKGNVAFASRTRPNPSKAHLCYPARTQRQVDFL